MDWRRHDAKIDLSGFDPEQALAASAPVKENLHRTVAPCEAGGRKAFLKRQASKTKARLEAENTIRLREAGIPAAAPLATAEDEGGSWLLTEEIPGGKPLHDIGAGDPEVQRALGRLLKDLHEAGCWHPDLHTGNVLVSTAPDGRPWLTVMDTAEARFLSGIDDPLRIRSLGMLAASLEGLSAPGHARILKAYLGILGKGWKRFARKALAERDRIWDVHWKSRTKRCTRTTGAFEARKNGIFRRGFAFPPDALESSGTYVKRDRGTSVRRDGRICIKTYPPRHALDRLRSRARRAWIRANALWERDCATAQPLAWIEDGRDGTGYLVTEDLSSRGLELDRWISRHWRKLPPSRRLDFLHDLGRSLARMADRGVWPGDAKACNFFVVEDKGRNGWTFPLVDVDGLRLRHPDILDVAQGLMQLHLSTPRMVSRRARARLVRDMLGPSGRRDWKELMGMTAKLAGTERILYQSDSGDVTEEVP